MRKSVLVYDTKALFIQKYLKNKAPPKFKTFGL